MSAKPKVDPERAKSIRERAEERNLLIKEIMSQGPSTVEELSRNTGIVKPRLVKHMIAMRQFGKVTIVGERNDQLVYDVVRESK